MLYIICIQKPNSGLKFAFSIMDFSKENTIMGDEFSKVSMALRSFVQILQMK